MQKIIFVLLILTLLFPLSCKSEHIPQASMAFTGDIIMHNPIKYSAYKRNIIDKKTMLSLNNRGFDYFFKIIKNDLKKTDIIMGNMEFPIHQPYLSGTGIFNCYPEILPSLHKAGFTMANIANNHILDQKADGIRSTIKELQKNRFDFIGVNQTEEITRNGLIKNIDGIKIGFIGYTGVINYFRPKRGRGYFINWFYNKKRVIEDIVNIKQKCDYLVLTFHAGKEYHHLPQKKDRELLKIYIENGVDLVIGNHPHVLQPIEKIKTEDKREAFIFYSLGNFISNQSYRATKAHGTQDSAIVRCYLSRKKNKIIDRFELLPIRTFNKYLKKQGKTAYVFSIPRRIKELKQKLLKTKNAKKKKSIKKEILFLQEREIKIKNWMFRKNKFKKIKFITSTSLSDHNSGDKKNTQRKKQ